MEKPPKLLKRSTRKMRERSPEKVSWGGGWSSNERGESREGSTAVQGCIQTPGFSPTERPKTDFLGV